MNKKSAFVIFIKRQTPTLVVLLLAVIGLILLPFQVPMSKSAQAAVLGPRFVPTVMLWATIGFCCLSFAAEAFSVFYRHEALEPRSYAAPKQYIKVACMVAALILWYLLLKTIGFVPLTALLMMYTMYLLGNRAVWQLLVVPTTCSVLIYLVFSSLLNVPLPAGFLAR